MRRLLLGVVAAAAAYGGLFIGGSAAQQGGGGQEPIDAVRAAVPQELPEDFDLAAAQERFGPLVRQFGDTAEIDVGGGSSLTGPCGGIAMSYDQDGALLDAALDAGGPAPPVDVLSGGQAFTSGNPFRVDTRGSVAYFGFMPRRGQGPKDNDWKVTAAGIPLGSGGDDNADGDNRNAGVVDLADRLPFSFSLDAQIDGHLTSANLPDCVGSGHVRFQGGSPLTSVPGLAGTAFLVGGLLGLLLTARPEAG